VNLANKKIQFSVLLMAAFLIPVIGSAQQKNSERNEYEQIIESARKKVEGQSHRQTTIRHIFDDDNKDEPSETRTWVTEVLPPDRQHVYYGLRSATQNSKWESIRIGKIEYRRTGDAAWEKREWKEPGAGSGSGSGSREIELHHRGKRDLNGIKVDLYEKINRSELFRKGNRKVSVSRTQYFIGPDGLLLKEISDSDNVIVKRMHLETSYDTAAKISIEAPIP
jgi:hypothetical protein